MSCLVRDSLASFNIVMIGGNRKITMATQDRLQFHLSGKIGIRLQYL